MGLNERHAAIAELRHAAERIRWAGSRATEGPWYAMENDIIGGWCLSVQPDRTPAYGATTTADIVRETDAFWIERVGPHISVPLAELLEEAAAQADEHVDSDLSLLPLVRLALPLAWAILRAGRERDESE